MYWIELPNPELAIAVQEVIAMAKESRKYPIVNVKWKTEARAVAANPLDFQDLVYCTNSLMDPDTAVVVEDCVKGSLLRCVSRATKNKEDKAAAVMNVIDGINIGQPSLEAASRRIQALEKLDSLETPPRYSLECDMPEEGDADGIYDFSAKIREIETNQIVGSINGAIVDLRRPRLSERMDAHSADMMHLYESVFDRDEGEIHSKFENQIYPYEPWLVQKIFYIHHVQIKTAHRKQRLGLSALEILIEEFASGCQLAIADAGRPGGLDKTSRLQDYWTHIRKMREHWGKLGFVSLTENFLVKPLLSERVLVEGLPPMIVRIEPFLRMQS